MTVISTYFLTIGPAQLIGVVGFLLYLGSFAAVQFHWMCGNGLLYPVANVAAACCVMISLTEEFNLASFLIQFSFIVIGMIGIARRLMRRPPIRVG